MSKAEGGAGFLQGGRKLSFGHVKCEMPVLYLSVFC